MRLLPSFARLAFAPFAAVVALAGCAEVTGAPRIFVSNVPSGVHVAREDGDAMKLDRWELEPRVGLTRGYWVVGSEHEWRELWPSIDADRIPLLPTDIDFANELLLVAAPADHAVTEVRIHAAINTAEAGVHVYLTQSLPGKGCPAPPSDERVPVSAARVPRFSKEVHFHVEAKEDSPCEAPPEAKIGCRLEGPGDDFSDKLVVEPGKMVACRSEGKPGMRPTVDRTWSFRSLPQGTISKMTIAPSGSVVTFPTDVYGTYAVGLEVTDDLGRTSKGTADVQVAPPKDELVVQMVWTKFEPTDDPSTFPRVELHVAGDKTPIPVSKETTFASRNQPWILVHGDCTVGGEKLPAWCHSRAVAQTSIASVVTDLFPQYRIGVKYLDDRYAGQPVLCVRAFRGALASEWCDKAVRSEGNWWDVARVDAQTGKIPVPPAPPTPPPAPAAAPAASGGAAAVAAPVIDPNKPRKPGDPWSPTATATPTPNATPTPKPSPAPSASPQPKASAPASSSTTPKPRQPGDPWTP